jgi:hypothetical protein
MMAAPVGALVRIFYDGHQLGAGDALVTPSGRTYVVVAVRVQRRGQHVGRQHLACLVAHADARSGRQVFPLFWYPRRPRPR